MTNGNRPLTDPCVVFALRRESMYFRRAYSFRKRFAGAPCRAEFRARAGESVLMLETGIGATAMETAVRWCLSEPRLGDVPYRPRSLLLLGFSGSLQSHLQVGDVVQATEIVDLEHRRWPTSPLLEANRNPAASGRLLTVPRLLSDPTEKQALGSRYNALAVDMESAVVARLCLERRVPFACLRVISDDMHTALSPQLVGMIEKGRLAPFRLAASALCHPRLIGELCRLAKDTRKAARNLFFAYSRCSAPERPPL